MSAVEEYRCAECGAKLAHPAEKHTIIDCGYEWKRRAEKAEAEVERLRKRLAVLDDLGYDLERDSVVIHRDAEVKP